MSTIFDPAAVVAVLAYALLAKGFVDALITPLFEKQGWDKFYLLYVAWIFAGVLTFATGSNLFVPVIQNVLVGQILSAVVAGVLSNLMHDATDKPEPVVVMNMVEDNTV